MIFPFSMSGYPPGLATSVLSTVGRNERPASIALLNKRTLTPPTSSGAGLSLRNVDRGEHRAIHPGEINQVAVGINHGNVHFPIPFLGFCLSRRENLLCTIKRNWCAVGNIKGYLIGCTAARRLRSG